MAAKHVSFPKQREQCRLNNYTYTEKCESCKAPVLMCNYPFPDPSHRKGVCRASTCTDMRKTLAEVGEDIAAIEEDASETCGAYDGDGLAAEGEEQAPHNEAEASLASDNAEEGKVETVN